MSEQLTEVRVVTIGNATLYLGDCRGILPRLPMFDLLLTDPPYGLGEAAGKNKSRSKPFGGGAKNTRGRTIEAKDYGDESWDDDPVEEWVLAMLRSRSKHQIIFGGNYYPLPSTSCVLVWDKENSGDFADCELAWTNLPGAVRIFRHMWNGMLRASERNTPRVHPTQKPVALMEWALSMAPAVTQTVCDPFMGSGTTGVACANLGKSFVGIERSEKYFEIACERIAAAHAQGRLIA